MSKLITNTVRHTAGSADNITLDNSQNVTVEGALTTNGLTSTTSGDCLFTGTTSGRNCKWDTSHNRLIFDDNAKGVFGGGGDLEIFHDGSKSYIKEEGDGGLIVTTDSLLQLQKGTSEVLAKFTPDGAAELLSLIHI